MPQMPHLESIGEGAQENRIWNAPRMRQMHQEHDIDPTNETASKRPERGQLGHESDNNRKIHRRDAEGAEMDNFVESIGELAGETRKLTREAYCRT